MNGYAENDDDAIIAASRAGFVEEADQLLQLFERSLLGMERAPTDPELINAAFRAAHTIKGTSGLFGIDAVVGFTHEVETVLEAMRSGRCVPDEASIALLLQSRDQIQALLLDAGNPRPSEALAARSAGLGAQLREILHGTPRDVDAERDTAVDFADGSETASGESRAGTAAAGDAADPAPDAVPPSWRIRAEFGPDALRNGLEPLSFLRYLGTRGRVTAVQALVARVPTLAAFDPETCYLGFEVRIETASSRDELEQVFEFAAEDCELLIEASPGAASEVDSAGSAEAPRPATTRPAPAAEPGPAAGPTADAGTGAEPQADRRAGPGERRRSGDEQRFIRVQADKLDALIDLIGELVIASSGAQIIARDEASPRFGEAAQRIRSLVESARDGALALRMVPIGDTFARFHRVVRDVSKQLGKSVDLQITGGDTELDKSMIEVIADPLMHLVRNSLDHGIETAAERVAAGKPQKARIALNAYHESGVIVIEVSDDGRGLNGERILAKAIERGLVRPDHNLNEHDIHQLICTPGFSTAEQVTDISGRGVGMDVVKRSIEALRGQMQLASSAGRGTTTQIRLPLTLAIIDGFLCSVGAVHYVVPLELVAECIEVPHGCRDDDGIAGYFDLRGEVVPYLNVRGYLGLEAQGGARQSMIVVRAAGGRVGLLVDRLLGEYQTVIKPLGPLFQGLRGIGGSTILGSGEVALILDVPALLERANRSRTTTGRPVAA
ncbi:MAG: chemotaxis protein CheA [Lautropia sp.]